MEKLGKLKLGEQLAITGHIPTVRNVVSRFHKKNPEKRIRVLSSINVVVRLV